MEVHAVQCLRNTLNYIVIDRLTSYAALIDCSDSYALQHAMNKIHPIPKVTKILFTHCHTNRTLGLVSLMPELERRARLLIGENGEDEIEVLYGDAAPQGFPEHMPTTVQKRLRRISEDSIVSVGIGVEIKAISLPVFADGQLAYIASRTARSAASSTLVSEGTSLFTGDALSPCGGIGRLGAGREGLAFEALQKLKEMLHSNPEMMLYFGHDEADVNLQWLQHCLKEKEESEKHPIMEIIASQMHPTRASERKKREFSYSVRGTLDINPFLRSISTDELKLIWASRVSFLRSEERLDQLYSMDVDHQLV